MRSDGGGRPRVSGTERQQEQREFLVLIGGGRGASPAPLAPPEVRGAFQGDVASSGRFEAWFAAARLAARGFGRPLLQFGKLQST